MKITYQVRVEQFIPDRVRFLAERLGKTHGEIIELAISRLDIAVAKTQPVEIPEDEPTIF
jgi:hypothetical protein